MVRLLLIDRAMVRSNRAYCTMRFRDRRYLLRGRGADPDASMKSEALGLAATGGQSRQLITCWAAAHTSMSATAMDGRQLREPLMWAQRYMVRYLYRRRR